MVLLLLVPLVLHHGSRLLHRVQLLTAAMREQLSAGLISQQVCDTSLVDSFLHDDGMCAVVVDVVFDVSAVRTPKYSTHFSVAGVPGIVGSAFDRCELVNLNSCLALPLTSWFVSNTLPNQYHHSPIWGALCLKPRAVWLLFLIS